MLRAFRGGATRPSLCFRRSRFSREDVVELRRGFERCASNPRSVLVAHLPRIVRDTPAWRDRVGTLPPKYRSAILAAEIGAAMIYRRPMEPDFGSALEAYVAQTFQ